MVVNLIDIDSQTRSEDLVARRRDSQLDPRSSRQIADVVDLLRGVLGDDVLALYLYGSAAIGRLRPFSDLDVFAVSRRRTTNAEKRALIDRLLAISGPGAVSGPGRSIELTIVSQPDVRPWRYPPRLDFQYGDWFRPAFERGEHAPWQAPNPDLAILIANVLGSARPLVGPPPDRTLDPVPRRDLARAMRDATPDLLDDLESDTTNVILTLARIWTTVATGEIRSKDAAAAWALDRLRAAERPVLARARAIYLGDEEDRWDDLMPLARSLADHLVDEVVGPSAEIVADVHVDRTQGSESDRC
jgi:streptomycin 3"-adenylyltransferase